jgi:plastocyanin
MHARLVPAALCLAVAACSSKSAPGELDVTDAADSDTPGGGDAGVDAAPITDASTPLPLDAPDVLFNYDDCTNIDFDQYDETAPDASRHIVFSFHANVQQYAPRCMKIKAGDSVTWEGDFTDHPLVGAGGDVPNPVDIAMIATGTLGTIAFPNQGWYGFECQVHESPLEYGAILVVP